MWCIPNFPGAFTTTEAESSPEKSSKGLHGAERTYGKIQKCVEKVDKHIISQQKPHVRGGYGCYKWEKRKLPGLCVANCDINVNPRMSFKRDSSRERTPWVCTMHTPGGFGPGTVLENWVPVHPCALGG